MVQLPGASDPRVGGCAGRDRDGTAWHPVWPQPSSDSCVSLVCTRGHAPQIIVVSLHFDAQNVHVWPVALAPVSSCTSPRFSASVLAFRHHEVSRPLVLLLPTHSHWPDSRSHPRPAQCSVRLHTRHATRSHLHPGVLNVYFMLKAASSRGPRPAPERLHLSLSTRGCRGDVVETGLCCAWFTTDVLRESRAASQRSRAPSHVLSQRSPGNGRLPCRSQVPRCNCFPACLLGECPGPAFGRQLRLSALTPQAQAPASSSLSWDGGCAGSEGCASCGFTVGGRVFPLGR